MNILKRTTVLLIVFRTLRLGLAWAQEISMTIQRMALTF